MIGSYSETGEKADPNALPKPYQGPNSTMSYGQFQFMDKLKNVPITGNYFNNLTPKQMSEVASAAQSIITHINSLAMMAIKDPSKREFALGVIKSIPGFEGSTDAMFTENGAATARAGTQMGRFVDKMYSFEQNADLGSRNLYGGLDLERATGSMYRVASPQQKEIFASIYKTMMPSLTMFAKSGTPDQKKQIAGIFDTIGTDEFKKASQEITSSTSVGAQKPAETASTPAAAAYSPIDVNKYKATAAAIDNSFLKYYASTGAPLSWIPKEFYTGTPEQIDESIKSSIFVNPKFKEGTMTVDQVKAAVALARATGTFRPWEMLEQTLPAVATVDPEALKTAPIAAINSIKPSGPDQIAKLKALGDNIFSDTPAAKAARAKVMFDFRAGLERNSPEQLIAAMNAAPSLFTQDTITNVAKYAADPMSMPKQTRPAGQSGVVLAQPVFGAGLEVAGSPTAADYAKQVAALGNPVITPTTAVTPKVEYPVISKINASTAITALSNLYSGIQSAAEKMRVAGDTAGLDSLLKSIGAKTEYGSSTQFLLNNTLHTSSWWNQLEEYPAMIQNNVANRVGGFDPMTIVNQAITELPPEAIKTISTYVPGNPLLESKAPATTAAPTRITPEQGIISGYPVGGNGQVPGVDGDQLGGTRYFLSSSGDLTASAWMGQIPYGNREITRDYYIQTLGDRAQEKMTPDAFGRTFKSEADAFLARANEAKAATGVYRPGYVAPQYANYTWKNGVLYNKNPAEIAAETAKHEAAVVAGTEIKVKVGNGFGYMPTNSPGAKLAAEKGMVVSTPAPTVPVLSNTLNNSLTGSTDKVWNANNTVYSQGGNLFNAEGGIIIEKSDPTYSQWSDRFGIPKPPTTQLSATLDQKYPTPPAYQLPTYTAPVALPKPATSAPLVNPLTGQPYPTSVLPVKQTPSTTTPTTGPVPPIVPVNTTPESTYKVPTPSQRLSAKYGSLAWRPAKNKLGQAMASVRNTIPPSIPTTNPLQSTLTKII